MRIVQAIFLGLFALSIFGQTNVIPGNPVVTTAPLGVETNTPWAPLTIGGAQALGFHVLSAESNLRVFDLDFNGLGNGDSALSGALYRMDLRPGQPVHQWWTRSAGAPLPNTLEDARMVITEGGNVGIGTTTPGSSLTVAGLIESLADGVKFPDGSVQRTAALQGPPGPPGSAGPRGPQGVPGPQGPVGAVPAGVNVNLAFNPNPGLAGDPSFPNSFESDQGWGGGAQPSELIDGFRGCNGPGGWACGLAFTGGNANWGGQACGVRQATIDLGASPDQVSAVRITHHGDDQVPKIYEIQTLQDGQWVTQVSITDNSQGRCGRAPSYDPQSVWTCVVTDEFFPVQTTKVRYTFNNCPSQNTNILGTSITHGWLYEFEVYRLPI